MLCVLVIFFDKPAQLQLFSVRKVIVIVRGRQ